VIVLDTHAWLWWLDSPQMLSRAAARVIERADEIGV
jgi:PIN domain nuclease of toxin-antitoxin system